MIRPFLCPGLRSKFSPAPIGADGRSHIENLWEWARFMFERLVVRIEPPESLASTAKMTRRYHRDYLNWLEPVERLVRSLLITRAITWLTMTPEGQRLRANTPKQPHPGPRPTPVQHEQQPQQQHNNSTTTLTPPTLTPEEIEACYLALPVRRVRVQTRDPKTWICSFRILSYDRSHPPSEEGWRGEPCGLTYEEIAALDYIPRMTRKRTSNFGPSLRVRDPYCLGRRLARRVEALGRAIANSEHHMKRAARFIARLQPGLIQPPDPPLPCWMQGADTDRAAVLMMTSAVNALNRVEGVVPEPG